MLWEMGQMGHDKDDDDNGVFKLEYIWLDRSWNFHHPSMEELV